ncbi:unnamed protein product [Citrullus colocynthis]|uniref:Uncharacterized protein n=1 Tax=Citrullus colocynthis TaxID=252529 RepID=A0ABP0YAZ0_9ROSI
MSEWFEVDVWPFKLFNCFDINNIYHSSATIFLSGWNFEEVKFDSAFAITLLSLEDCRNWVVRIQEG